MKSRVTTKKGDQGTSRTLGGDVLPKCDPVLECTGRVDSLRAHTALARLQILDSGDDGAEEVGAFLFWLLHCYFLIGTAVNDPRNRHPEYSKGEISKAHLNKLEAEQQRLEAQVDLSKAFIASASNAVAAQVDVTATVARDLERQIVRLKEAVPEFEGAAILAFINRLSDYLYILARFLEGGQHLAVDYGVLDEN